MKIPDYVSPIVAHRVWQCDSDGLVSLNGERWYPARPLAARCKAVLSRSAVGRAAVMPVPHEAPQMTCTCGIYAAKSLEQLPGTSFRLYGVCGEVYLWGTIVEHSFGWRAQFAYPKSLILPVETLWFDQFVQDDLHMKEVEFILATLTAYRANIFMLEGEESIALWTKRSGYNSAGLERLREAATRPVTVPVAVLTEDRNRHILLQNGMEAKHAAEIVFYDVQLPLSTTDPIVRQIHDPRARVVVIDLNSNNLRLARHAIKAIRATTDNVVIFVRGERSLMNVAVAVRAGADDYLARDGRFDVQDAFTSLSIRRMEMRSRGGASPPGGPPPPSAVPVLSPRNWPRRPRPREVALAM